MALAQKPITQAATRAQGAIVPPAVRAQPAPRRVRSSIRAEASNGTALAVTQKQALAQTNGSATTAVAPVAPVEEVDLAKHMQDRHAHILR